jgi:hypothetical protein
VNLGDDHMSLKLVASNDDGALAIRDHLLLLVRQGGGIEVQRDLVRLITWEQAPWVIHHWTPFNDLQPGEASSPGYRRALERQHAMLDLPYGLEVWHGDHRETGGARAYPVLSLRFSGVGMGHGVDFEVDGSRG